MRLAQLEFLLHATIVIVIVLATMLLGLGERSATLTLITLGMIAVSTYFTDVTQRFRLTQRLADCAALLVVVASAVHAYYVDRHTQMLAVANLQSYLQYVLLFQQKTPRVYWQLALLSLGQMAIASTLVPGPTFGVILLLYLFSGIVAFALLLLFSESVRCGLTPSRRLVVSATMPAAATAAGRAPQLFSNVAPASLSLGRGSLSLGWGLSRQAGLITAVTIAVTACVFFVLPRWNVQTRQIDSTEPPRSVGFSKTVTLGELGEVVNNPDVVMRVEFYRGRRAKRFKLAEEPLFRGTVLTHYDSGSWSQRHAVSDLPLSREIQPPFVLQRITMESLDVPELFSIFPVFSLTEDSRLRIDFANEQLVRQEDVRGKQIEFEVATTGIRDDRQRRFIPCESTLVRSDTLKLLQMPRPRGGVDSLKELRDVAASVLQERSIDPDNHVAIAQALDEHLRLSGRYFYSLEGQQRDPKLDPLEDFVTKHRVGHCEYFAGALVMMLRSLGIPARIALGFKAGEWNPVGMYYQVQQLHAHAWVEAYITSEQIPAEEFADDWQPRAAWMVLDPTGINEQDDSTQGLGLLAAIRQYLDYGQVLWSNYVVGLNSKRQRQGIYEPLAQGFSAGVENLFSPQVWQGRMRAVSKSHLGTFWEWYRRHWFSWRGGLVAVGFSLLLFGSYVAGQWLLGKARAKLLGRYDHGAPPVLEMYRRLEAVLGQHGILRLPSQTAYEFALGAGGDLAEKLEHRRLAHLPRRVVEAFYRVRFGGQTLDNLEAEAVEHALVELELALAQPR